MILILTKFGLQSFWLFPLHTISYTIKTGVELLAVIYSQSFKSIRGSQRPVLNSRENMITFNFSALLEKNNLKVQTFLYKWSHSGKIVRPTIFKRKCVEKKPNVDYYTAQQ